MSGTYTSPSPESRSSAGLAGDALLATFRDPAGELRLTADKALRRVHPEYAEEALAFLTSSLYAEWQRNGQIVSTKVLEQGQDGLLLEHPLIQFPTYPWEWTAAQWKAAAELTLDLCRQGLAAGWMLKDATPMNILFDGARPVFVDVLSFERRQPGNSVWTAYGQFVRTFLLPLAAEKYLHWPLALTAQYRDGYEPRALYHAMHWWQRLNPSLLDVVTLATKLERKGSGPRSAAKAAAPATGIQSDPAFADHLLNKRLSRLRKQIEKSTRKGLTTDWSQYTQTLTHYSNTERSIKEEFVARTLAQLKPSTVLDIGANTGVFSRLSAESGAQVMAVEYDTGAAEALWQSAAALKLPITTVLANIARPTPAIGWDNAEYSSLLDRLADKFDLVLMLAVIHHLLLSEQVPLRLIAPLSSRITRRWLVVEWVPAGDPMFQELLRGRDKLYGHLAEEHFLAAFNPFFLVRERHPLDNGRILFLLEKTNS